VKCSDDKNVLVAHESATVWYAMCLRCAAVRCARMRLVRLARVARLERQEGGKRGERVKCGERVKWVKRDVRCDTWRRSVEPDAASGAGEAGAGAMEEVMGRMSGLKVRGTTTAAGYLVFSVIDFVQGARQDTATYAAATLW
jgi:hypothetical protein